MDQKSSKNESRRKFIKTAGKFAIYTPPALMMMSQVSASDFAKSGANGCDVKICKSQ